MREEKPLKKIIQLYDFTIPELDKLRELCNFNDYSGRRGRDARTGRYVSRDNRGYSRAMDKQRMIGKLEDMMDDAPSEKERRALQQCVTKLEQQ